MFKPAIALTTLLLSVLLLSLPIGCTDKPSSGDHASGDHAHDLPETLFLKAAPASGSPLQQVKASAKVGDTVTIKCRIGGRSTPFVESRAIMVVIDPSLPSCADTKGDMCKKPWDYCCETPEDLIANTATVQVMDPHGHAVAMSLEGEQGLNPLAWITVVGEVAVKDDAGQFVVNATGIFVEKQG